MAVGLCSEGLLQTELGGKIPVATLGSQAARGSGDCVAEGKGEANWVACGAAVGFVFEAGVEGAGGGGCGAGRVWTPRCAGGDGSEAGCYSEDDFEEVHLGKEYDKTSTE